MQKYSILLTLASVASAGCCTIYSEANMQGDSHQLCYDSSTKNPDRDYNISRYDLSNLEDFKVQPKSISCDSDYTHTTGWYGWYKEDSLVLDYAIAKGIKSEFGIDINRSSIIRVFSQDLGQEEGFARISYGDNKDLYEAQQQLKNPIEEIIIFDAGKGGSTVTVYDGENCTNLSMSYHQPLRGDDINIVSEFYEYKLMTFRIQNVDPEEIKSIRVPAGFAVDLYDPSSDSPYQTIFGRDNTCFKMQNGDTNETTINSMSIYSNSASVNFAIGSWILMSSNNQGQTVDYHLGLTSTDSTETTAQMSTSITNSMSAGIKFGPEEAKESVSMTVSESIKSEVDTSTTKDSSRDYQYPCYPPKDGEDAKYGATLYQWQVDNGTVTSMDNIVICRTGKDTWNSPPNCPPSACADALCQTCHDWKA